MALVITMAFYALPVHAEVKKSGSYTYSDGSYYAGDISDSGLPNGKGSLNLVNGDNLIIITENGRVTKISMSAKANKQTYSNVQLNILLSRVELDTGLLINNRVLVPLRQISENLGANVEWNGNNQTITLNIKSSTVSLPINSNEITVNGLKKTLEVPAQIFEDTTFVPLRFVSEELGATVNWDETNMRASVNTADKNILVKAHYYFTQNVVGFVYDGNIENGLPNGYGTAYKGTSKNGEIIFNGFWKNGNPMIDEPKNSWTIYGKEIIKGMTKQQVLEVLGEPSQTAPYPFPWVWNRYKRLVDGNVYLVESYGIDFDSNNDVIDVLTILHSEYAD
jgi:hypothetical protein